MRGFVSASNTVEPVAVASGVSADTGVAGDSSAISLATPSWK